MANTKEWKALLNIVPMPAFAVEHGVVVSVNRESLAANLPVGSQVKPILLTGEQEYDSLEEGSLCLTIDVGGCPQGVAMCRFKDDVDLFLLDQEAKRESLRILALAAQKLRDPLNAIMGAMDHLIPELNLDEAPFLQSDVASINRGAYQILRLVGNMSDAVGYLTVGNVNREKTEVGAYFGQMFEKAGILAERMGITVTFKPLKEEVMCYIDRQKMERAVYNLLSNALRFTPKGGTISCWLTADTKQVVLHIQDDGEGLAEEIRDTLFTRYLREPTVEDNRYGMGLGLLLVRQIASQHGGTILISPEQQGTTAALSMERKAVEESQLRSPIKELDYAGNLDHSLLELSGELPAGSYCFGANW